MKNIALVISYNGKNYNGWQKQKNAQSIQEILEKALCEILGQSVTLTASGRTDAGVSAVCQVANFKVNDDNVNLNKLKSRLNFILPDDIKILNCYFVSENFNARFDAKNKTYAYNFYLSKTSIPYFDNFATQIKNNVNMQIFEENLKMLVGTYDFTSFCASNNQTENKVRTIYSCELIKNDNLYTVKICGNGFLYNMVRIIIGTLIDISSGKLKCNISEIIEYKDRTKAGHTASSKGLVLLNVNYNEIY